MHAEVCKKKDGVRGRERVIVFEREMKRHINILTDGQTHTQTNRQTDRARSDLTWPSARLKHCTGICAVLPLLALGIGWAKGKEL